uniref:Uncharacterized protein n=1 Tax=Acrobeloides nanus TaxID=290746 RepID=A0A914CJ96_9BILA
MGVLLTSHIHSTIFTPSATNTPLQDYTLETPRQNCAKPVCLISQAATDVLVDQKPNLAVNQRSIAPSHTSPVAKSTSI